MARYSSSSSTGAGSMRAVLMLMLLLGAVVAAHGRKVSCENKCPKFITVNGVYIPANAVGDIEVEDLVEIKVLARTGVVVGGPYFCPQDVSALVVVYDIPFTKQVKLRVKAVVMKYVLSTLLGRVLGLFPCQF